MAEANPSLRLCSHRHACADASGKAVKRQYQAKGLKVHHFARRDIVMAANEYLREHRELIAEAAVVVEQWRKEGFFGKRLRDAQNLRLSCVAQSRTAQGFQIHECQTQNGRGK